MKITRPKLVAVVVAVVFLIALVLVQYPAGSRSESAKSPATNLEGAAVQGIPSIDSTVTSLTDELLQGSTPLLVRFFLPTCPHCRNDHARWFQLKAELESGEDDLTEVEVNAADAAGRAYAQKVNVKGVPYTLLMYPPDLETRPPTAVQRSTLSAESVRELLRQQTA
eukprot:EC722744.1.p1 GENE.EC722744.1~~EC722744.1.p1  ORF type:complete len:167 (+),score=26.12 EC722744.1:109-609(+)